MMNGSIEDKKCLTMDIYAA